MSSSLQVNVALSCLFIRDQVECAFNELLYYPAKLLADFESDYFISRWLVDRARA